MPARTAIRVISLESAIERREKFILHAEDARTDWEYFSAYTGLTSPLRYDERAALRRYGHLLSASEVGCYTSHYKVWEWFIGSKYDQIIIMEDDVLVEWAVIRELAKYNFSQIGVNVLRLFAPYPFKAKMIIPRFLSRHIHLLRVVGIMVGGQGYLLTRRGAEALLRCGKAITLPVDEYMGRYWVYGMLTYALFPFPMLERHVASTIGGERELTPNDACCIDRLSIFCWRLRNNIARAWTQWFQMYGKQFVGTIDTRTVQLHKNGKGRE